MTKTEALKEFLKYCDNLHLAQLYSEEMEVQVNVAQGKGKRISDTYKGKRWVGWTDGNTTWKSFRIPWQADSSPTYTDTELRFDLSEHVDGIGLTGWNWAKQQSIWVGFDFDSLANHKAGLSDAELNEIKEVLFSLPYVTLVKSTSGKGYHLYIHLENPVPTKTHTEHAALARSILSVLTMDTGYNFFNSVDCCGMVLWVYHKKQEGTDGLSLLKKGDPFPLHKIPANWRSHIEVTSGRRRKIKSVSTETLLFEELTSAQKQLTLDDGHRKVLKWFSSNTGVGRDSWWDQDNNMLVCHTLDLKRVHVELGLRGIFETNSTGSTPQNCYAFPTENGSWVVRRHSMGVKEHPMWIADPSGWTRCVFNAIAELPSCARANLGIENAKGEYVFSTAREGIKALMDAGATEIVLPERIQVRNMTIKEKEEGRIIINIDRDSSDPALEGFLPNKKGDMWERVIYIPKQRREIYSPDYLIRHVIVNNAEAGWWIYTRKKWIEQNKSNVTTVLLSQQDAVTKYDVELLIGKCILNPWELVSIPFSDEYPGDRCWNKDAAKIAVSPVEGDFGTWSSIIEHCGHSLNSVVENNSWCQTNAIHTGAEYLICWIANLFQRPTEPLPYLFFVGPQNCGKSTLHEALNRLMIKGYARADQALTSVGSFNGELEGAVLCVVEETNLNKNKEAANRIKDWVTGRTICIRDLFKTAYDIPNTTHWIQCANDPSFCPILPGDTRIVLCRVDMPSKEIPKAELFTALESEAAAFLYYVLNIELPAPEGRLALPCLTTEEKTEVERYNSSELEQFMLDNVKVVMGHQVTFDDFYSTFIAYLSPEERGKWSKSKVSRYYPKQRPYCKGKTGTESTTVLGNVSLDPAAKDEIWELYTDTNGRIQRRMK